MHRRYLPCRNRFSMKATNRSAIGVRSFKIRIRCSCPVPTPLRPRNGPQYLPFAARILRTSSIKGLMLRQHLLFACLGTCSRPLALKANCLETGIKVPESTQPSVSWRTFLLAPAPGPAASQPGRVAGDAAPGVLRWDAGPIHRSNRSSHWGDARHGRRLVT